MKTMNETFDDEEYLVLSRIKKDSGLNWHDFIITISEEWVKYVRRTYNNGRIKTHRECGGLIRYTENMDPSTPQIFDMECLKCGKMVCEDEIEFERRIE